MAGSVPTWNPDLSGTDFPQGVDRLELSVTSHLSADRQAPLSIHVTLAFIAA